jgi:small subunit ribosomal protein S20
LANHKSAAKRARQTKRRTAVNARTKSAIRTFEKSLRKALNTKDAKAAQELLVEFSSKAAKAAQKGVIKARTVSRKVSALSKHVHQLVTSK